jgi:hypothetical protein
LETFEHPANTTAAKTIAAVAGLTRPSHSVSGSSSDAARSDEKRPAFSGQPWMAASNLRSPEKVDEQERAGRERRASSNRYALHPASHLQTLSYTAAFGPTRFPGTGS